MDAPEPPEIVVKVTEEPPNRAEEQLGEHREVLDRGWPFVRVPNKPFDPLLHDQLTTQTRFACHLPSNFTGLDLPSTAMVVAHVARRGTNEDIKAIIVGHTEHKPTAAAAFLLLELKKILEKDGRDEIASDAHKALERLIEGFDWDDVREWEANGLASGMMLDIFASVTTTEAVRSQLSAVAKVSPEMGAFLVPAVAGTSIQTNTSTGDQYLRAHFRFPKEWLPVEDLLNSADAGAEDTKTSELRSLISELKDLRDRGRK
jgi:hypothetical protein